MTLYFCCAYHCYCTLNT